VLASLDPTAAAVWIRTSGSNLRSEHWPLRADARSQRSVQAHQFVHSGTNAQAIRPSQTRHSNRISSKSSSSLPLLIKASRPASTISSPIPPHREIRISLYNLELDLWLDVI
jgi:hypothetical protein